MLKPKGGRDTYFNIRRLLTLGLDYLKTRNFQITIKTNVTVDVHRYVILDMDMYRCALFIRTDGTCCQVIYGVGFSVACSIVIGMRGLR